MSTEAPPQEAAPVYNQQDTASRHSELFRNLAAEQQAEAVKSETIADSGTDLAEVINKQATAKAAEKPAETNPVADLGIPDEILGIEKKQEETVDEWEKLHNEEVKGQVKNENFKKYKDATGKKISALTEQMTAREKELQELRSKINPDFVPEKLTKEMEELRTKLKEREDLIGKKYVQESREFRERFSEPQTQLLSQLKKAGEELGFDNAQSLLNMSLKKRVEVLGESELSVAAQSHLTQILQQHDALEASKEGYLSQWESKRAEMDAEEARIANTQKAEMKKYQDEKLEKVRSEMMKTFAPLKRIEGNDAWNSGIDEIDAKVKAMYDGEFSDEQFAEVLYAGFGAKRLHGMFEKVLEWGRGLAAEVAQLKAADPSINGETGKTKQPSKGDSSRFVHGDSRQAWRDMVGNITRENEIA